MKLQCQSGIFSRSSTFLFRFNKIQPFPKMSSCLSTFSTSKFPTNQLNLNISRRVSLNYQSLLFNSKSIRPNNRRTLFCTAYKYKYSNILLPFSPRNCFRGSLKNINDRKIDTDIKYIRQYGRSTTKAEYKKSTLTKSRQKGHGEEKKDGNELNGNDLDRSLFKASVVGLAGGTYGALVGLGGSFVIIPLSLKYLRLTQHQAQATSLASVIGTGGMGATSYFLAGYKIDLEAAIAMAIGAMLTANLGANLVRNISSSSLQLMYGVLQLAIGPMVVYKEEIKSLGRRVNKDSVEEPSTKEVKDLEWTKSNNLINYTFQEYIVRNLQILCIGLASGLVAGIFGIGGGAIVVPALSVFTDLSHHSCIGTSLCSMVPAAMVGMATHYRNGTYTGGGSPSLSMISKKITNKNILPLLLPLAIGSGIGSYFGGKHIAPYVDESSLQILFAAMMTYLGVGGIKKSGVLQRLLANERK